MNVGNKIIITAVPQDYGYFSAGDTATLTHIDNDGDWYADFDTRHWGECIKGREDDHSFCLQESVGTKFELYTGEKKDA